MHFTISPCNMKLKLYFQKKSPFIPWETYKMHNLATNLILNLPVLCLELGAIRPCRATRVQQTHKIVELFFNESNF